MTDVIEDRRIRQHFPALVDAARTVGSVQIRNRATLAGNLCNASPAADTAPVLLAHRASLNLVSAGGTRQMPLDDFFTGPGRTVLAPGELVASIDLPLPVPRTGGAFGRLTRRHGVDLAIVCVCCVVRESGEARFAFGAVGPRPFVVTSRLDAPLDDVWTHARPISDVRANADYRLAMLPVLTRRALREAVAADARGVGRRMTITLTVNGTVRTIDVQTHHSLLELLRDQLNLTGTKECCAEGECGSCTVLLNGRAVNACLVLAAECDGENVATVEGLALHGQLDPRPTGVCRKRRRAVRILHSGHGRRRHVPAVDQSLPERRRDQGRTRRKSMPLRGLQPHHPGCRARGDETDGIGPARHGHHRLLTSAARRHRARDRRSAVRRRRSPRQHAARQAGFSGLRTCADRRRSQRRGPWRSGSARRLHGARLAAACSTLRAGLRRPADARRRGNEIFGRAGGGRRRRNEGRGEASGDARSH